MAKRTWTYLEVVEWVERAARTVSAVCAVFLHFWGRRPRKRPPGRGRAGNADGPNRG